MSPLSSLLANRFVWRLGNTIEKGQWDYIYNGYRRKYEIAVLLMFIYVAISVLDKGRAVEHQDKES